MTGKQIIQFFRKLEENNQNNPKMTPEQQKQYDAHYDRLADRGGMTHQQIHNAILKKLGIKPKPK
jgi:hypothetical protein